MRAVFLMIRFGGEYLLKRDCEGGHWELPATGINAGETPRECVLRSYGEKFGLRDADIKLIGLRQVVFEKTAFRPGPKPEYLALFEAVAGDKDSVLKNADRNLHRWYAPGDEISPYCPLCRGLIESHSYMAAR